nr:retrovirus-related Pol polyprotein from transposon TNT 1-94 [Tanacetum cinerariifolium]
MTGNLKLLTNFVQKILGTVKFGNDQIAPILSYGYLVQGKVTIKRVYYVKGLNHNIFFIGQLCDVDLEVAFQKSTCCIRNLKGSDFLTSSRGTDLYSITLQDTSTLNPICLMDKATSSRAWLWHRPLSHLNFDTINLLSKNDIVIGVLKLKIRQRSSLFFLLAWKSQTKVFSHKDYPKLKRRLQLLHMDLCGLCGDGENLDKMKEKGDACIFVGLMFDELLNGTTLVVSKSFVVNAADAPNKRQQQYTTQSTSTTVAADTPPP